MLRITQGLADGVPTLKVEGSITGPWVKELERAVEGCLARSGRLKLDLSEVNYADAEAATLLRDLVRGPAELGRRSTFIAELLLEGGNR